MWLSNNILTLVVASAGFFEVIIGPVLWDVGFKRAVEWRSYKGVKRKEDTRVWSLYIASVACN
jgi:hypothetical protein